MKSRRTFLATAIVAFCLFFGLVASSAFAAAPKKKLTPPPDLRKLVKSVDKANNAIVISYPGTQQTHTYKLDDMSTIQIDGSSAKFSDIKAGMEVADSTERDNDDLDSVSLLSKTAAPTLKDATPAEVTGSTKTIQAVHPDTAQVVIFFAESKLQHTYRIDANTELKVNGVSGTFGDIKAGMKVTDYAERDNDDLDSLTVTGY